MRLDCVFQDFYYHNLIDENNSTKLEYEYDPHIQRDRFIQSLGLSIFSKEKMIKCAGLSYLS